MADANATSDMQAIAASMNVLIDAAATGAARKTWIVTVKIVTTASANHLGLVMLVTELHILAWWSVVWW